ncbi:hypothetical protein NBRC116188_02340 [Oceaniserpentilla sp. 4NH20-0058]
MHQFLKFCWFVIKRFERNQNRRNAAELTFVTLFAVVPLMTSGYVMLTWFPQYTSFIDTFHDFVFQHFVPTSGEALQSYLGGFSQQAKKLTWIGLGILVFSAVSLMLTVEKSFNHIWRVNSQRAGKRVLFYWLMVVLGPILLGSAFLVTSYLLSSAIWLDHVDSVFHVNQLLFSFLPFIISVVALSAMYFFLPNTNVVFWHALLGGVIGSLVLELCKSGFVSLVALSPSYQLIYGAFAVVPLFLMWIFLAWSVVLFGAELVRAMPFVKKELVGEKATQLDWALLILQKLKECDKKSGLDKEALTKALNLVNIDDWQVVLNLFLVEGWLDESSTHFYLKINLKEKSVAELTEILYGYKLDQFTVIKNGTVWFDVLKPIFRDIRKQKQAVLELPIFDVI